MKKLILLIIALIAVISLILWLNRVEKKLQNKEMELPKQAVEPAPSLTPKFTPPEKNEDKKIEIPPKPEPVKGGFHFSSAQKEKWYPKLKKDLLAFESKNTKISIEAAPAEKFGDEIKILLVSYLRKNGSRSSFKGLFNTKSGKIIRTWDQTQFEPIHKKEVLISPSGVLK
jgi:hypothetical protein